MHDIPSRWLEWLDALTAVAEGESGSTSDDQLLEQVALADPDLLAVLVAQLAAQESPQAAGILEMLAATPHTPEVIRPAVRAAIDDLASKGITALAPDHDRFYAGWAQSGRERGEQILILGWRLPSGSLEALVFLLDWRGDGLKDFYRTRQMTDAEWRELLKHNGQKGAPLVEISLAEGRALLDAALAESRRFSRPLPREYKRESGRIERLVLQVAEAPGDMRSFVTPDLSPEDVVHAYVAALHYRDYALAAELLAPEFPSRSEHTLSETIAMLRSTLKHAPRRRAEVHTERIPTTRYQEGSESVADATTVVSAEGSEVHVEPSGRRIEYPVHERYVLRHIEASWRITTSTRQKEERQSP